jgi:sugar O-acyltransferase (sialic acid O-acetyltransferase NeuD family)
MDELILVGGGGHCVSCIDVIETSTDFKIIGIIDIPEKVGLKVLDYEVIGTDQDLQEMVKRYKYFLITIGQIRDPKPRISLFRKLTEMKANFPVIISSNAYVSKHAQIGGGTIVMHGAVVNARSNIGSNCIVNSLSLIEHDAFIADHCHIATSAVINGGVTVGQGSFIGSGAITKQYITIPEFSFIRAHSITK